MADDDLDLSEFEEFSSTAKSASGGGGAPGGGGSGSGAPPRKRRRWPWFLAGLVLGALGAIFGPDLAAPYLPEVLRPGLEEVRGPVLGKRIEGERLLLTVDTERGAVLATFRQRVPEIDLLVDEGDTITLGLGEYAPLVEDPVLAAVRKGGTGEAEASPGAGSSIPSEGGPSPGPPTGEAAEEPAAGATEEPAPPGDTSGI